MQIKKTAKGSHFLRKGRFSGPGNYYFITTSTYRRRRIFTEPVYFNIVFNSLRWLEKEKRLELYFVIAMPDHLHIVFELGEGQTLLVEEPDKYPFWWSKYEL